MMNIKRGSIALLSTSELIDEGLDSFCRKNGYELVSFNQIEHLMAGLKARPYILCILDCDYPSLFDLRQNGKDVFDYIEKELVVPSAAYSRQNLETKRSLDLYGIGKVITKPFSLESEIVQILVATKREDKPDSGVFEDDYCGLFLDDFLFIKQCPFDLYCRINETKAVKILHAYDEINRELLMRLKNKGVSRIFLKRNDYRKFIAINAYSDTKGLEGKERLQWIQNSSNTIINDFYHNDMNLDRFFAAKQVVESTLDLVADNGLMFDLIKTLSEMDNDVYKHSLGMSIYAVLIASKMEMTDPRIKFRLSIAGLFADIGTRRLPAELLEKSRILYNNRDQNEYNRHVDYSVEIMKSVDGLPEEILQVISQHHENLDGSGFPRRMTKFNMHPLSKILRVADEFCFLTIKTRNNKNILSPIKALEQFKQSYNANKYDQDAVKGLELLLTENTNIKKVA